jgi:hypothetical protein
MARRHRGRFTEARHNGNAGWRVKPAVVAARENERGGAVVRQSCSRSAPRPDDEPLDAVLDVREGRVRGRYLGAQMRKLLSVGSLFDAARMVTSRFAPAGHPEIVPLVTSV